LTVIEEESGTKPPMLSRLWQSHVRRPEAGENVLPPKNVTVPNNPGNGNVVDVALPLMGARAGEVKPTDAVPIGTSSASGSSEPTQIVVPAQPRRLPPLRVIGQLSQSYIVTEGPDGMYLIDQHAAHERILLERMVAALQASTSLSQLLLTPIALELAPSELEAIEEHMQELEHIGFTLEILEDGRVQVRAVPNVLIKQMNARSLRELLAELTAAEDGGHAETWEEHALANVACKAAIKANYFLAMSEMREMIEQLEQTNAPYSCCHGRPTMVHFSLPALEREFGRR
jgi:DNA mismatch repair protein MutL